MRSKFLYLFVGLMFLAMGAGAQAPAVETKQVTGYLLGPGDEITAKVLGEGAYDFVTIVNEDGNVEIPFHEKPILAKCKTERQLRTEITGLLKRDLVNPQLSLRTLSKSRLPTVVYGEVRKPEAFVLMRKVTLVEMIALAGGVMDEAGGMVQVFRTQPPMCPGNVPSEDEWVASTDAAGVPYRMYSLAGARMGLDNANPTIMPGDVVVVQRAKPIYIVGEVVAPQGVYLKEGGLTLMEAIAKVGGIRREAKTKEMKVHRLKPNSKDREVISVNYEQSLKDGKAFVLEPEDIIEVGKAKDSIAKQILSFAIGAGKTMVSSGVSSAGYRVVY